MTRDEIVKAIEGLKAQTEAAADKELARGDKYLFGTYMGRVEAYSDVLNMLTAPEDPMVKPFPIFNLTRQIVVDNGFSADITDEQMGKIAKSMGQDLIDDGLYYLLEDQRRGWSPDSGLVARPDREP